MSFLIISVKNLFRCSFSMFINTGSVIDSIVDDIKSAMIFAAMILVLSVEMIIMILPTVAIKDSESIIASASMF
jgi:hypothetical protein